MKAVFLTFMLSLTIGCSKQQVPRQQTSSAILFQGDTTAQNIEIWSQALIHTKETMPGAPLILVLNSSGGDVNAAASFSALANSYTNISLMCMYCASSAGWIFESSVHPRLVAKKSQIMMH